MSRPMTRLEMREEVYARLGERAGFYTDANINQWLNDGVDDLVIRLEPVIADSNIDITAGTWEYLLPEDLISIKTALTLDSDSNWVNMTMTTFEQLFRDDPSWESTTAAPPATQYYWKENVIGIFPVPTISTPAGLRIIYTCRPAEMATDTSITGLSSYMDRSAVFYAVMMARMKDRDDQRAAIAKAQWTEAVTIAGTLINKHRKENAPHLVAQQRNSRQWWYNRTPRFRAISGS